MPKEIKSYICENCGKEFTGDKAKQLCMEHELECINMEYKIQEQFEKIIDSHKKKYNIKVIDKRIIVWTDNCDGFAYNMIQYDLSLKINNNQIDITGCMPLDNFSIEEVDKELKDKIELSLETSYEGNLIEVCNEYQSLNNFMIDKMNLYELCESWRGKKVKFELVENKEKTYIKTKKPESSLINTIFPLDILVFYDGVNYCRYMVISQGNGKLGVVELNSGYVYEMNCLYGDTLVDKIEEEFSVEWVCKEEN